MSGMQEAPGTVEFNYAKLADTITAEADNELPQGRDFGRVPSDSAVQIVQHPTSEDERNGAETNKKLTSAIMPQNRASKGQGHSHARPRPVYRKFFCRAQRVQNENDNLDAQIRIFKEREDLRECRIPGMISGISQKACEGWRRQATGRYARFPAKIKLGLCKDCKYSNEAVVLD